MQGSQVYNSLILPDGQKCPQDFHSLRTGETRSLAASAYYTERIARQAEIHKVSTHMEGLACLYAAYLALTGDPTVAQGLTNDFDLYPLPSVERTQP